LEQPKKPGPRDITDLKARLGLNKGAAAPAAPAPGAPPRAPFPGPPPGQGGPPGAQPYFGPPPGAPPGQAYGQHPQHPQMMGGAPPAALDPYAAMRPPPGRQFDLSPVNDGQAVANVKSRGFTTALIFGAVLLGVGAVVGIGFGMAMGGRRVYNQTNRAAKQVSSELDEMQKTVSQIETAVTTGIQRAAAKKTDRLSYDGQVIDDLEKVKLDPRPDTSRIFRLNYMGLPDIAVDNLMAYYYDTIALYNEVERHVKKTKADKESLAAFAAKQGEKTQANYGVVFTGGGKMVIANLVEVGKPVCKGGGEDCPAAELEGFQIRSGAGSNWSNRKVGAKPDGNIVVPLDRTPLLETVMAGSPEQARMEQFRGRYANIQLLLARLKQTQKALNEAVKAAAQRADMWAL
jgi:outer membrane murein-binding lipoprotein Lpp